MAIDDFMQLDRAAQAMREAAQPGWAELSASIRAAVRSTIRRSVDITADPGEGAREASELFVADSVLKLQLRDGVNTNQRTLVGVDLHVEDGLLIQLDLELVCRFGADALAQAEGARVSASEVVLSALGGRRVTINALVVDIDSATE